VCRLRSDFVVKGFIVNSHRRICIWP